MEKLKYFTRRGLIPLLLAGIFAAFAVTACNKETSNNAGALAPLLLGAGKSSGYLIKIPKGVAR